MAILRDEPGSLSGAARLKQRTHRYMWSAIDSALSMPLLTHPVRLFVCQGRWTWSAQSTRALVQLRRAESEP